MSQAWVEWDGDTFRCWACKEEYPNAKRGIAQPCVASVGYIRDNWPPNTRHHWPSGMPESLKDAWFWYEVRRRQIEEGLAESP